MFFVSGLHKTSAFTNHSDGSEFKVTDTEPAPYSAGPGGMAPAGIPSYRPVDILSNKPKPSTRQAMKERAIGIAMIGKLGSQGDPRDSSAYIGTAGQGAETLVSQLKYETTTDNITESMGYNNRVRQALKKGKKK
jgi:hypothetical protein